MSQHLGEKKAYQRRYRKQKVKEARAKGMCVYCFHRPQVDGTVKCAHCREVLNRAARARQAKLRDAWRALGMCHRCGKEAIEGTGLCGYHSELRTTHCRTYRTKLAQAGKCFACGGERDEPQFKKCSGCRAKQRAQYQRAKRIGKGNTVIRMAS